MEACVGSVTISNAGEFNGFLKPKVRLFADPLQFAAGELLLTPGYWPGIKHDVLAAHEVKGERFAPALLARRFDKSNAETGFKPSYPRA